MSAETAPQGENMDSPKGFAFALSAYFLWGFLPFYMKAIAHIPPTEVIAHRVIWSLPVAGSVVLILRRTSEVKAIFGKPRMLAMAVLTAAIITFNWGIYIWAIAAGRTLDAALGYFINPLFSVLMGALLLGERLRPAQKIAIGLAALGVVVLTVEAGSLPWVALALTVSWGFYAFFRKTLPIGPNQGFFLEVLILALPSLGYIIYLEWTGQGHFLAGNAKDTALLVAAGVVTAVPLILYANGAKLLKLSTIGIMQYIAPTMIFLIAVFAFDEPFGTARMIAFPLIWTALAVYTTSMFAGSRNRG